VFENTCEECQGKEGIIKGIRTMEYCYALLQRNDILATVK